MNSFAVVTPQMAAAGEAVMKNGGSAAEIYKAMFALRATTRNNREYAKIYSVWLSMWRRCTNSRCAEYGNYGGRGISICERWISLENFIADMGYPPKGLSIDRIDVNGNYEPANCRWATPLQQVKNRRRRTRCVNGHDFSPDNTYLTARGSRACKACGNAASKRYYERKKAIGK